MAKVTELVTEFKFKGNTKPLKEAGDQMQRVSENSGIAAKRMDNADDSMKGLSKSSIAAAAALAGLAAGIMKSFDTVLDLGREVSELKGLGIDPKEYRDFEDLFVQLGSSAEEGGKFIKKFAENMNLLELGKDQPFFRAVKDQFGVEITKLDDAGSALKKIREGAQKGGFSKGNVGTILGQLGFDPNVTKVLTATQTEFNKAVELTAQYTKLTEEQINNVEEVNEEFKKLSHETKRVWEAMSADLAPAMLEVIEAASFLVGAFADVRAATTEKLVPIFDKMFDVINGTSVSGMSRNPSVLGGAVPDLTQFGAPASNSNSTTTINVNVMDRDQGAMVKQKVNEVLRENNSRNIRSR